MDMIDGQFLLDDFTFKELVITLKYVVDGLLVHGITSEQSQKVFDLLTNDYIYVQDNHVHSLVLQSICKMLQTQKFCERNESNKVESILMRLIIQLFDKSSTFQSSKTNNMITVFM